jgi:hypothetical protein
MINPTLVKEVIQTRLTDDEIESDIASALVMYRNFLGGSSIPSDLQVEIERYLAAHFVSLKDASTRVDSEKIGDAAVEYSKLGKEGTGLKSTRWGQTAIDFDPTGILGRLGNIPPKWYAL